jgi:hypothetical protein
MTLPNFTIAKVLASVVILGGFLGMLGWTIDQPILAGFVSGWVPMKFATTVSFFMSGLSLLFIVRTLEDRHVFAQVVLPFTSLVILLLMATLLFSVIIGVHSGIEELLLKESSDQILVASIGPTSIATMFNFTLVGLIGIVAMVVRPKTLKTLLRFTSVIVGGLGLLAVLGYAIGVPSLTYSIRGLSTAMSHEAAILFFLFGVGGFVAGIDGDRPLVQEFSEDQL